MLILSTPLKNLNKSLLFRHNLHHHYYSFLPSFSLIKTKPSNYLRLMATISSSSSTASDSNPNNNSSNKGGAFTTIKERVMLQKEIKKSKFIAIAGPISDERSAQAFLSEVIILIIPPFTILSCISLLFLFYLKTLFFLIVGK